ncbi:hypothetical protein KY284_007647 [Solanum tuberosum]|nr:hypothetical protein KY284_007647 [Solanum tuberosum]
MKCTLALEKCPSNTLEFPCLQGKSLYSMPLVEKMTARIKYWTTKFLPYSGRVQLIKSVIFEMQTYWAQVFLLPKKVVH